jgi:macrolide-specific efflux system membrane fusion protein
MTFCLTLVLPALALLGPLPPPAESAAAREAHLPACLVSLGDDVQVPALESGPLVEVLVKEGDFIQSKALLARIDDEQAQLQRFAAERELRAALAQAEDDISIRFAQASQEVSAAELQRSLDINRRAGQQTVSEAEINRQRLEKHRAELQIDRSRLEQRVALLTAEIKEAEVKASEASMRRRRILAPLDGMVADVYRRNGEWVNAGDPVLRLVRMDTLRVEGFVDAARHNPADVAGRPVRVFFTMAGGRRVELPGQIVFVSPEVQAGNKHRVRAEVRNRHEQGQWLLRPGMSVEMTVACAAGQ